MNFRVRNLSWAETPSAAPLAAVNAFTSLDCEGAATAVVQVLETTGLTGGVLTFEGRISETAPWVVLTAYPTNGTAKTTVLAATAVMAAVPAFGWVVSVNGMVQVRARLSARTAGSLRVGIKLSDVAYG